MIEIRFHGRGGQGSVTAAEILAKAAFKDGKSVQAFPFFGVERRGAPVMAFTRIDELLNVVDVFSGIKDNTEVIINTKTFEGSGDHEVHKIDATGIALDMLGRNIVNTIILGYFAKKTGVVSIDSLLEVIKETFPGKIGELNAEATKKAYDMG